MTFFKDMKIPQIRPVIPARPVTKLPVREPKTKLTNNPTTLPTGPERTLRIPDNPRSFPMPVPSSVLIAFVRQVTKSDTFPPRSFTTSVNTMRRFDPRVVNTAPSMDCSEFVKTFNRFDGFCWKIGIKQVVDFNLPLFELKFNTNHSTYQCSQ